MTLYGGNTMPELADRGFWQYGLTESIYISEADYVGRGGHELRPCKAAQIEDLRIIDDDCGFAAAQLIAQNGHGHGGTESIDGDIASRPQTLNWTARL